MWIPPLSRAPSLVSRAAPTRPRGGVGAALGRAVERQTLGELERRRCCGVAGGPLPRRTGRRLRAGPARRRALPALPRYPRLGGGRVRPDPEERPSRPAGRSIPISVLTNEPATRVWRGTAHG